jgi:hypothetical protein
MKFILSALMLNLLAGSPSALAQDNINELVRNKKYDEAVRLYEANPAPVIQNEYLSYSVDQAYEKLGRYDDALKVNFATIATHYQTQNANLVNLLKNQNSISGDAYPKNLKAVYFRIYNDYAHKLNTVQSRKDVPPNDEKAFGVYKKALESLEYQENLVDKINDQVTNHLKDLDKKVYHWQKRVFIQYLSWQTQANLVGPTNSVLLATNQGVCPGVGLSYANLYWVFGSDLCFLYGTGGVTADTASGNTYQQNNVKATGLKGSLNAGAIVSSSLTELGLKLSLLYTKQNLNTPPDPTYTVNQANPTNILLSVYSRFLFGSFYFETEFGRYVSKPATVWAFAGGYTF